MYTSHKRAQRNVHGSNIHTNQQKDKSKIVLNIFVCFVISLVLFKQSMVIVLKFHYFVNHLISMMADQPAGGELASFFSTKCI